MKTYALQDLLSNKIDFEYDNEIKSYDFDGISIPIIQRDYAQGREKETSIRNRFLRSIFSSLQNDEILELDFVYGSISKLNDLNFFQPLDGQQRLTTLFLINWYVINRELQDVERQEQLLKLQNFSYETRTSSRLFCHKICSINFQENPKTEIESSYWFHDEFKNDPTVRSMLQMLNDIHVLYDKTELKLYDRLLNLRFYVLPLDGFNLSDELYIKMNDRGKQLSNFENFKADLINWMKSGGNPEYDEFNKSVLYKDKHMPYYLMIASKFDNDWSDMFWAKSIANQEKDANEIDTSKLDAYFLNFINNFLTGELIIRDESKAEDSNAFKFLYDSQSSIYTDWSNYENSFEFSTIERLNTFLDKLVISKELLRLNVAPSWNDNFTWFIDDLEVSQVNRILFHSIYKYVLNNNIDEQSFKEWIRVVWNFIIDPDIRSISAMINVIRLIDKISMFSENILENLVSSRLDQIIIELEGNFAQSQLIEEKNKAIFILSDVDERDKRYIEITECEKHPLFQGNVNFIVSGVDSLKILKHNRLIAFDLFDKEGALNLFENNTHILFRYIISQFDSPDKITSIYYRDDYDYWQLLLRRKENVFIQRIISDLFKFKNSDEIKNHLLLCVSKKSSLQEMALEHTNLYYYNDFHKWFQDNGLDVLWDYSNHLYINRYRSSNDRVLIDNLRNELINKIVIELNFDCEANCGDTKFYKGRLIDCEKRQNNGIHITIKFYENDFIDVGIWSGHNIHLKDLNKEDDYWIECIELKSENLSSEIELDNLFIKIKESINQLNIDVLTKAN